MVGSSSRLRTGQTTPWRRERAGWSCRTGGHQYVWERGEQLMKSSPSGVGHAGDVHRMRPHGEADRDLAERDVVREAPVGDQLVVGVAQQQEAWGGLGEAVRGSRRRPRPATTSSSATAIPRTVWRTDCDDRPAVRDCGAHVKLLPGARETAALRRGSAPWDMVSVGRLRFGLPRLLVRRLDRGSSYTLPAQCATASVTGAGRAVVSSEALRRQPESAVMINTPSAHPPPVLPRRYGGRSPCRADLRRRARPPRRRQTSPSSAAC